MHQAPAAIWNRIAETQTLATEWAEQMFPLPAEEMEAALEAETDRLAAGAAGSDLVAHAYRVVMPLVWERKAIAAFQTENGPMASLPVIETAQEAVIVASKDYPLTKAEQKTLSAMLRTAPT